MRTTYFSVNVVGGSVEQNQLSVFLVLAATATEPFLRDLVPATPPPPRTPPRLPLVSLLPPPAAANTRCGPGEGASKVLHGAPLAPARE
jgi:hypothetical protein